MKASWGKPFAFRLKLWGKVGPIGAGGSGIDWGIGCPRTGRGVMTGDGRGLGAESGLAGEFFASGFSERSSQVASSSTVVASLGLGFVEEVGLNCPNGAI